MGIREFQGRYAGLKSMVGKKISESYEGLKEYARNGVEDEDRCRVWERLIVLDENIDQVTKRLFDFQHFCRKQHSKPPQSNRKFFRILC